MIINTLGVLIIKNTQPMHDLKTNFDKISPIVNDTWADQFNPDRNLQEYPNKPNRPDSHLIALGPMQEALSIVVNGVLP